MILTYFTKSNDFIQSIPQSEIVMRQLDLGPMFDESLKLIKSVAKDIEKPDFHLFIY